MQENQLGVTICQREKDFIFLLIHIALKYFHVATKCRFHIPGSQHSSNATVRDNVKLAGVASKKRK